MKQLASFRDFVPHPLFILNDLFGSFFGHGPYASPTHQGDAASYHAVGATAREDLAEGFEEQWSNNVTRRPNESTPSVLEFSKIAPPRQPFHPKAREILLDTIEVHLPIEPYDRGNPWRNESILETMENIDPEFGRIANEAGVPETDATDLGEVSKRWARILTWGLP